MRSRDRSTYVLRFPLKPSYVYLAQSSPVQVFDFRLFIAENNFLFSLCQIFFEKLSFKMLSSKFYRSLLLISMSRVRLSYYDTLIRSTNLISRTLRRQHTAMTITNQFDGKTDFRTLLPRDRC